MNGQGPPRARVVGDYLRLSRREVPAELIDAPPRLVGWCRDPSHLLDAAGGVRAGALLAMVDTLGGFLSGLAVLPRWIVTTNLALSQSQPGYDGPLVLDTTVLRRGRNSVVAAVDIGSAQEGATPFARATVTSSVLDPGEMTLDFARPVEVVVDDGGPRVPFDEFFPVWGADPNATAMEVSEQLRNPWGILHGGAVGALVDAAAARAASAHLGRQAVSVDAVVQFLSPVRVGPAEARATVLDGGGDHERAVVQIDIVDIGAGGRPTAWAVVTTAAVHATGGR